jgi:hypothetical protein
MEMTNENGNHNDLPDNDPTFKWAWEIYRQADHLVHSRTTFFFVAQSFLVVAYSTFAVNWFNWKENQSVEGICRAKMAACQNNFWNGYSGLPAPSM